MFLNYLSTFWGAVHVYGYFNNHYHGYAPENCMDVLDMLGIATPEQKEMGQRISGYRKGKITAKAVPRTLSDFLPQEKEDITTLFSGYIEASRLEKAGEIKDIEIIELGADKIVADVRGYSIYIDLEKRFILHDCGDWKRTMREKRFCKHIGALMLALPERMRREACLGVSEGSSGNSASIRGEGRRNMVRNH